MTWFKKHIGLFIIILVSLWVIKPLFVAGLFPMHDDTQVARVFEMGKALKDGMFPVRWSQDLGYGYGYPLFNFYGPLAYYVGGFFLLLNIDALIATKLMMGIGMLLAGVSMYVLGRKMWGQLGGIISALFYMYAPYHAVDLYVRGAIGELWAYAFIPLVFYGLYMVYQERKWQYVSVGSFGLAGVILSHNLTAFMLIPFLGIFILFLCIISYCKDRNLYSMYYILYTTFLGLILSAFYWLPALGEMTYTNVSSQIGGSADFRNHFVCVEQLWSSQWGFGGSAVGCLDGLSFMIGKLHIVFVILSCIAALFLWKKEKTRAGSIVFSFSLFLLSCVFMLDISKPFWEIIPQTAFIQYPWRFLTFTCFFSSFLAGGCIYALQKSHKQFLYLAMVLFIVLILFAYSKFFVPQTITTKTAADYTSLQGLRWDISKISDEYMPVNFIKVNDPHDVVNGRIVFMEKDSGSSIEFQKEKTQEIQATIFVQGRPTVVEILLAHFPAWQIFVDGKPTVIDKTNRGFLVKVGQGKHIVEARYYQTNIEKIGNIISLIGFGIVVVGIMYSTKKGVLSPS